MSLSRNQIQARAPAEAAYTLAEVMVSVLMLAVLSVSLYECFAFTFAVIQSSREEVRATQIAVQKLEAIRLCTYSQLSNCPISFVEYYDPTMATQSASMAYYGTVTTNACTNLPDSVSYKTNMTLVTVTLNWTNYNGRKIIPRSTQMQTQVALKGMQNYIWGATQ